MLVAISARSSSDVDVCCLSSIVSLPYYVLCTFKFCVVNHINLCKIAHHISL
ncbi:hypothetical protein APW33_01635 [Staphylococcus aureus]|nr:hypothetical protein APW33_01635 [Staphylococcus aureus]